MDAINVSALQLQSQGISFAEWIQLFTLGLTPLATHIAVGAPQISYLSFTRPKWHDLICHFNPTSILWRYAAIADRRVRSLQWDKADMAATNAVFWTARGWASSERMTVLSLQCCTRLPERSRVAAWSWETFYTLIVTLQGAQSVYLIVDNATFLAGSGFDINLQLVFFPISLLGLLRLFAAFWLTQDYAYSTTRVVSVSDQGKLINEDIMEFGEMPLDPSLLAVAAKVRFRSSKCWPSRILRAFYAGLLFIFWIACAMILNPFSGTNTFSVTALTMTLSYFLIISVTLALFTYYHFRGRDTTTVIPCVSYAWYKVYSVAVVILFALLIIFAAVETHKTACNGFSTLSNSLEEEANCEPA